MQDLLKRMNILIAKTATTRQSADESFRTNCNEITEYGVTLQLTYTVREENEMVVPCPLQQGQVVSRWV